MKLAEALLLRGDLKRKLCSLKSRIKENVVIQEGDKPSENPEKLMKEAHGVLNELSDLIIRVNSTNQSVKMTDGRLLTEAIAKRDQLVQKHVLLMDVIDGSKKEPDRYSLTEIKWVSTVDIKKLHKQADDVSKQIRELNAKIQLTNWSVDLA